MSKRQIIQMYRNLITESTKIPAYNFRAYALRKIRDSFKENKNVQDQEKIQELLNSAQKSLDLIRRQAAIGQMYATEKLVIEK